MSLTQPYDSGSLSLPRVIPRTLEKPRGIPYNSQTNTDLNLTLIHPHVLTSTAFAYLLFSYPSSHCLRFCFDTMTSKSRPTADSMVTRSLPAVRHYLMCGWL